MISDVKIPRHGLNYHKGTSPSALELAVLVFFTMNERQIFEEALAIVDPAHRKAFLDKSCGDDAALRSQVESLLAVHAPDSQFLEVPAVEQFGDRNLNTGAFNM